jgi:hypothetical protein
MCGRGRPRGSHRSASAVLNSSLPGSPNQYLTSNAERMDVQPVKPRTCVGTGVADEHVQPTDGNALLTKWTDDNQFDDTDPEEVYASPPSQTIMDIPLPVAESTQGEIQVTVVARYAYLPAQTGVEGMFGRVPNVDYESPFIRSSRVLAPGPRTIKWETSLESKDTVSYPDQVCLSQRYRPIRLADTDNTEIVTPRRRKRTELEMLTL